MAGSSQLAVYYKEISKSNIPDLVNRINTKANNMLHKNVSGYDNYANLDHLKKLFSGWKEVKEFFMNSRHNPDWEALVKTVLERILHELSYNLETDDGQVVALQAVLQLKAEFNKLNWIVSVLKLQFPDNQEILINSIFSILDGLTKAENNANMLDRLKLIGDMEEIRELFMNSRHNTAGGGALVKSFLETILHELFYNLDIDNGQEVSMPAAAVQLDKDKLEKLNWIVSKLKLQLLVDSVPEDFPTISKINETIIPAVVAHLELANKYSLKKYQRTSVQVQKLRNNLIYIKSLLNKLEDNSNNLRHILKNFIRALLRHSAFHELGTDRQAEAKQLQAKLQVLTKIVIKLKQQISSPNFFLLRDFDPNWYTQVSREFDYRQVLDILPVLHVVEKFKCSMAFRDFRVVFENLELITKLCLLCFAVIPENEVVKKRFMTYWWVGEGFVRSPVDEAVDGIFEELVKKNCIEPVDKKYRFVVDSYKMNPFTRSAVIVLAKEAGFFDFDDKGNPSADFERSYRLCLVDGFCLELLTNRFELNPWKYGDDSIPKTELDPEKLQVIFNVNEPYPDLLRFKWAFSKFKNVKVLYLGRWQTSGEHHIQARNNRFMRGLRSMKFLRFLSLQGISRIKKLPRSVCKLQNLMILDLRACHDLQTLPHGIGSLKTLTHLDISECYRLDYIPKGISLLNQLLVLKGFVTNDYSDGHSCTLADLTRLDKLIKLSIYTNEDAFPENKDVASLQNMKALRKLAITWGAGAFPSKATTTMSSNNIGDKKTQDVGVEQSIAATKSPLESEDMIVFQTLEKLDLKSCPFPTAPTWLLPRNLPKLKKLYIRKGGIQNLSPVQEDDKWPNVEVLRLMFLKELKMDWKKFRSSFPGLIYLENVQCPNLTFFPCTEKGVVWLKAMN